MVTAPNPGFMTVDGTNQYLLGETRLTLIDAALGVGPNLDRLRAELDAAGASIVADSAHAHPPGSSRAVRSELRAEFGARLGMHSSRQGYAGVEPDWTYEDGDEIGFDGGVLRVVHTPGHESGHCCFYEPSHRWLFTGDHVVGQGTVVIAPPDGDMSAYVASLERLLALPATLLFGGHGPVVHDPRAKIQEYIAHRRMREEQVLECVRAGRHTIPEIVAVLYRDVHPALHLVAEKSVHAHLLKLLQEGRARRSAQEYFAP